MPDWLIAVVSNIVSGVLGAGGLAAWMRMRTDARQAAIAHQDEYTLKLRDALDKDEAEFRQAVYNAYLAEVARNRDLDSRLTTTQAQLTVITGERDALKREQAHTQAELERTQTDLTRTRTDLDQAHEKIRHLETEITQLRQQQQRDHP